MTDKQKKKRKPKNPIQPPKTLLNKKAFSKITALSREHIAANLDKKTSGWRVSGELRGNHLVAHIPTKLGGAWFDGELKQLTENTAELTGISGIDPKIMFLSSVIILALIIAIFVSPLLDALVLATLLFSYVIFIGLPYFMWIEYTAQKKIIQRIEQALG